MLKEFAKNAILIAALPVAMLFTKNANAQTNSNPLNFSRIIAGGSVIKRSFQPHPNLKSQLPVESSTIIITDKNDTLVYKPSYESDTLCNIKQYPVKMALGPKNLVFKFNDNSRSDLCLRIPDAKCSMENVEQGRLEVYNAAVHGIVEKGFVMIPQIANPELPLKALAALGKN